MKSIAIIDGFVREPAIHCFNSIVALDDFKFSYHFPALMGLDTLKLFASKADGYIVLGSASHLYQNLTWHQELATFLKEKLKAGRPVLGICFGHQLLAHAFGAKIDFFSADQAALKGSRVVQFQQKFGEIESQEKLTLAVSHRQVISSLPGELQVMAQSDIHQFEAVFHSGLPFWGFQAHPEASEHFCRKESGINRPNEIDFIQRDGKRVVKSFLNIVNNVKTASMPDK